MYCVCTFTALTLSRRRHRKEVELVVRNRSLEVRLRGVLLEFQRSGNVYF